MRGAGGLLRFVAALALGLAAWCAPAQATVTATFYSHTFRLIDGFRTDFPHAFVVLSGSDAGGQPVNLHLGFSAKNIFFNVLWQPVDGALDDEALTDAYVGDSIVHLSVPLSEEQYRAVMAVEHAWRTWPQPSYEIDTHNCVTFVKEIAVASGLSVSDSKKFIHAPADFLHDTALRNAARVAMPVSPVAATPAPVMGATLEDRLGKAEADLAAARDRSR